MTVPDLIDSVIKRFPDTDAVVHRAGRLTYRQMDRLADAVAADLLAAGARRESFVALLLEDRVELLVAMLGTMRAGAAFVPFDSTWPAQRQRRMLNDLAPAAVVGLRPTSGAGHVPVIPVRTNVSGVPLTRPPTAAGPDDPIYAFFTSGSTGRPKCAVNLHRGLVNRFLSMTERFAAEGAVVLQNSAHTFDSSIWQLLWPLTRGATVVIPDRDGILDFDATLTEIHRHRVTMTDFVPSIFDLLVERLQDRPRDLRLLTSLRQVFIGGESANPLTVHEFRRMLPQARVTNTYGPTEASIGSVFHAIGDADRTVIPLGRPLPNTFVLLLDDQQRPARAGAVGEIYLGGVCLGAGYRGDDEPTRLAFVPNQFPEVPGDTLYRTGDFGWIRDDGVLMFSGRRDSQVKIAGVRVDLGEVDSSITAVPGVHQVKAVIDQSGAAATLVCFYSAEASVTEHALRTHARARLPAALVPSRFVQLATLPLMSNGKVDQERLRGWSSGAAPDDPAAKATYPPDSVEWQIARIWTRVLGFSTHDNDDFFRVGGTSLGAARLVVELERALGVRLNARDLFEAPTIAAQAELVRTGRHAASRAAPHDIERDLRLDDLRPAATRRADPGAVLLIGATGFIGSHLLAALLEHGDRQIVCLVRATDGKSALDRVVAALAEAGGSGDLRRITALRGDLTRPRLGLAAPDWDWLCREVGTIADAGGQIDTLHGYADLRATNVDGLRSLIHLAGTHVRKELITLSTTTVRGPAATPLPELFLAPDSTLPADGYSQSKWVGEQLVREAAGHGIPATVIRLGEVAAHSRTGYANPRSLVTMILRLCLRLGVRPPTRARIDWTPVDTVAGLVAALAEPDCSGAPGTVLNALAPASVGVADLLARLRTPDGALSEIPYDEFLDRAADAVGDDDVARCLAVLRRTRCAPDGEPLTGVLHDALVGTDTFRAGQVARELGLDWGTSRDRKVDIMIDRLLATHSPVSVGPPHPFSAKAQ